MTTQNVTPGMEEERQERGKEENNYDFNISKVPKPKSWGREKRDKVLGWLHYASETVATL